MKQLSLLKKNPKLFHGGQIDQGKRKLQRPLSRRHALHLVLKAHCQYNLFQQKEFIQTLNKKYAQKFGVKVYGISVQRDHVHLNVRITDRQTYKQYIRSLTSQIARKFGSGMWKAPPFTRVLNWGADFQGVKKYLRQNEDEVLGRVPYKPRKDRYQAICF